MSQSWARFLALLEDSQGCEVVLQLDCKGAFLKFKSKLVSVDRPAACSFETMRLFGVVPQNVVLTFANGVRINLHMRHVEGVEHRDEGVVISFRGDDGLRNKLAFFPASLRKGYAG